MDAGKIEQVVTLAKLGFSVIPLWENNAPTVGSCTPYQSEIMSEKNIRKRFKMSGAVGVGIMCGAVSGNLELIDIDQKYCLDGTLWKRYSEMLDKEVLKKCVLAISRSGGYHIWYRTDQPIGEGNQKWANRPATQEELDEYNKTAVKKIKELWQLPKVLIETRGEGGYGAEYPTEKYKIIHGSFDNIGIITIAERNAMRDIAIQLDQMPKPTRETIPPPPKREEITGDKILPIQAFNQAHTAFEILQGYGWTEGKPEGNKLIQICRPGKDRQEKSGTHFNGYCAYIHSTSTPLPTGKWLSAFDVYAYYEHAGDYKAAAKDLYKKGYGDRVKKKETPKSDSQSQNEGGQKPESKPKTQTNVKLEGGLLGGWFRCLGYNKTENGSMTYYIYSDMTKMVVRLSGGGMSKPVLLTIAPLMFWEEYFGYDDRPGFNHLAAVNFITISCSDAGYFSLSDVRGRGAWMDDGRIVLHLGDRLYSGGKEYKLHELKTKHIYEMCKRLHLDIKSGPSRQQMQDLCNLIEGVNWKFKGMGKMLIGWLCIAPVCGALAWRPHIWLTAPAGSGKSWVMEIMQRLLHKFSFQGQGETTEFAVRASLNSDAIPVLLDEAEGNTEYAKLRLKSLLGLSRAASFGKNPPIIKGMQGGGIMEYYIRSCFAFASIVPYFSQDSDRRRITLLEFTAHKDKTNFERLENLRANLLTDEFCDKFLARMMNKAAKIFTAIEKCIKIMEQLNVGRAAADQLAPMAVGYWFGLNDADFSANKEDTASFITICREIIEAVKDDKCDEIKDEVKCLQIILSSKEKVEIEGAYVVERSIGELVTIASSHPTPGPVHQLAANEKISRLGLRVAIYAGKEYLAISNNHPHLTAMFAKTEFSGKYSKVLDRIEGAWKRTQYFTTTDSQRAVMIPLENIINEEMI